MNRLLNSLPDPPIRRYSFGLRASLLIGVVVLCGAAAMAHAEELDSRSRSATTALRLPEPDEWTPESVSPSDAPDDRLPRGASVDEEPLLTPPAEVEGLEDEDLDLLMEAGDGEYRWRMLPYGLIYRSYLAGHKEARISGIYSNGRTQGYLWDATLGGRVGILRYGTVGNDRPEGFQVDWEAAALMRLDPESEMDVEATDYRMGLPVTWGNRFHQTKVAYYHLSSHLGDEFLLKHPGYPRLNYSRDVVVWGESFYPVPALRLYGEVGYALASEIAQPWEFQFGIERSPYKCTGFRGAPFWALNAHLREEVDFGGGFTAQAGWAWRSSPASGLLRIGVDYYNGKNDQFSLYNFYESKVGIGVWYDY